MQALTIDGYVTHLRDFLAAHQEDWYQYLVRHPHIRHDTLYAFAMGHKSSSNPTLRTLRQMETLCREIDPHALG